MTHQIQNQRITWLATLMLMLTISGCNTQTTQNPQDSSGTLNGAVQKESQTQDIPQPYLPKNWFLSSSSAVPMSDPFPEDPTPQDPETLEKERSLNLERGIEELFRAQRMSLEEIKFSAENLSAEAVETRDVQNDTPDDQPKDWVPWRLVTVIGELGLSAKGLLGILAFQGSPAVAVYWDKKEQRSLASTHDDSQANTNQESIFSLSSEMRQEEIQRGLIPLIDGLMASGRISNRDILEKNMLDSVIEFQSTMHDVMTHQRTSWHVSRFRLDLSVSGSGVVSQGMSVGSEFRVRLEWHRARKTGSLAHNKDLSRVRKNEKLISFIQSLGSDLETLSISNSESSKFEAEQFRIGLGLSVGGDFGVAKGEAKVVGHIYFKRGNKTFTSTSNTSKPNELTVEDEPLYLITDAQLASHEIISLQSENLAKKFDRNNDGIIDEIVYKLDRKIFRKGLAFAGKMGSVFGKQAHKVSDDQWGVSKIKIDFDLSVGGEVGIVTLTGLVASQVEFINKNF